MVPCRIIYDTPDKRMHMFCRDGGAKADADAAGDAKHPEVQGIVGHTTGKVEVFANLAELEKLLPELTQQKSIFAVAQTTFNVQSWETCKEFLKNQCTNAKIFDTICNATWARQQEAEDLSQKCDHMVVIGGHHSSNTQKLLQVAARHTKAINVETADELDKDWLLRSYLRTGALLRMQRASPQSSCRHGFLHSYS